MSLTLTRIAYAELNGRQKENFNFQKVSAVLADYGFVTLRLSDDWQGADFIAQHIDGETFLKVQLKGRLTFETKYMNKELYVVFNAGDDWYLYPHDELLAQVLKESNVAHTRSWKDNGCYHFPTLTPQMLRLLAPYKIAGDVKPI